jgi:hypothetical protein
MPCADDPRVQEILADHGLVGAMTKFVLAGPGIKNMPDRTVIG